MTNEFMLILLNGVECLLLLAIWIGVCFLLVKR